MNILLTDKKQEKARERPAEKKVDALFCFVQKMNKKIEKIVKYTQSFN